MANTKHSREHFKSTLSPHLPPVHRAETNGCTKILQTNKQHISLTGKCTEIAQNLRMANVDCRGGRTITKLTAT